MVGILVKLGMGSLVKLGMGLLVKLGSFVNVGILVRLGMGSFVKLGMLVRLGIGSLVMDEVGMTSPVGVVNGITSDGMDFESQALTLGTNSCKHGKSC